MTHYAFIGSTELLFIALAGLLLFGRNLPQVLREGGKMWYQFRRTLNDLKRETGFDEAIRDIKKEVQVDVSMRDLRRDMDPFAGPAASEEAEEASFEAGPTAKKTPSGAVSQEDAAAEGVEASNPPAQESEPESEGEKDSA